MPSAYARFGNQTFGLGCDYSCGWGVTPGVITLTATIDFLAQNLVDTLRIYFNDTLFLQLSEVRFLSANAPVPTSGEPTRTLTLHDRRWKWQFGLAINGSYNQEQDNGTLIREKSPQELATILLEEGLGEIGVDVTALPSDPRPPISWLAARPAQELEKLLSDYGCTIVFDPFEDNPYVCKIGQGNPPPDLPATSKSNSVVYPATPDSIFLIGGPAIFQTALQLAEDVGLDVDGQYKLLKDLSYALDSAKPYGGFEDRPVHDFSWLDTDYTDPITGETLYHRDLASASVWKTKRIIGQARGGFSPVDLEDTDFEPTEITELGPFTGGLIELDARTKRPLEPLILGTFALNDQGEEKNQFGRFAGGVSIDDKRMLVTTSEPLYKKAAGVSAESCDDLKLIAAYHVTVKGVPVVYVYSQPVTGQTYGAGEYIDYHQDLVATIAEEGATWLGQAIDNRPQMDAEMIAYATVIVEQLQSRNAATREFPGLIELRPDGMLRDVTWSFSVGSSPRTTGAWNTEKSPYRRSWETRNSGQFVRMAAELRQRQFVVGQAEEQRGLVKGRTIQVGMVKG